MLETAVKSSVWHSSACTASGKVWAYFFRVSVRRPCRGEGEAGGLEDARSFLHGFATAPTLLGLCEAAVSGRASGRCNRALPTRSHTATVRAVRRMHTGTACLPSVTCPNGQDWLRSKAGRAFMSCVAMTARPGVDLCAAVPLGSDPPGSSIGAVQKHASS